MAEVTEALYDWLAADAGLVALLATFDGGPAIFSSDPVPEGAGLPYLTLSRMSEGPFDTKTTRGLITSRDVGCYAEDTGSAAEVEALYRAVRARLHRASIPVTGFATIIASVSGALPNDADDVLGRVLTVELTIEETP